VLLLMIGLGGVVGTYARYQLAGWVYARTGTAFPWGTLAVNMAGSFALGLVLPLLEAPDASLALRSLVTVGFLGAFTTFSSFAYEAVMLMQEGRRSRTVAYVASSLVLGLLCIAVGLMIGQKLL
jgi:fluoride exporter